MNIRSCFRSLGHSFVRPFSSLVHWLLRFFSVRRSSRQLAIKYMFHCTFHCTYCDLLTRFIELLPLNNNDTTTNNNNINNNKNNNSLKP